MRGCGARCRWEGAARRAGSHGRSVVLLLDVVRHLDRARHVVRHIRLTRPPRCRTKTRSAPRVAFATAQRLDIVNGWRSWLTQSTARSAHCRPCSSFSRKDVLALGLPSSVRKRGACRCDRVLLAAVWLGGFR